MADVRAQVILKTVDGISENYVTNSFAFRLDNTSSDPGDVTTAIKDFYDDIVGLLGPQIAQNGHEIKYTDLPGVQPNYPFQTDIFNLAAAPAGTAMPRECAIVLSFQGLKAAGAPQARRRGRIYLGPLDFVTATGEYVATSAITTITNAAATFKSAITAIGVDTRWGIWSHMDQVVVLVDNGWVDNTYDTQRRRGVKATSRTTWT